MSGCSSPGTRGETTGIPGCRRSYQPAPSPVRSRRGGPVEASEPDRPSGSIPLGRSSAYRARLVALCTTFSRRGVHVGGAQAPQTSVLAARRQQPSPASGRAGQGGLGGRLEEGASSTTGSLLGCRGCQGRFSPPALFFLRSYTSLTLGDFGMVFCVRLGRRGGFGRLASSGESFPGA